MQKKCGVAFGLIAAVSLAACSKGEATDSSPTNQSTQAVELLKAAGGDMKIVEASGGDIEKAKLLAAGKKLAEQTNEPSASDTKVPAKASAPEYRVVTDEYGTTTHVYPVKQRRSDGTIVIAQLGFEPGQRPSGKIEPAGGTSEEPLRYDMVQEIEAATGRPYQEGDTIWGRAQPE